MYLTFSYPEIVNQLWRFGCGIWPTKIEDKYCLIIKASKESILTAKINQGFHFYVAPVKIQSKQSFAIVTAFFDDHDEPLAITTPLVRDDVGTLDFMELLKEDTFDVFFLDENNRELLSYKAQGDLPALRQRIVAADLYGIETVPTMLDSAQQWFSRRTAEDDSQAFKISFVENLFSDDFVTLDAGAERHSFVGSKSFSTNSLEREEPGTFQEIDIVFLLQRVYPSGQIYLSPIKDADGKEFVDILVVGNEAILLIQAKDSPNTEQILRNTVSRKRRKSLSQMKEAANQLVGAISFARKNDLLTFLLNGKRIEVNITGKQLIGIIIVKELFDDTFEEYSAIGYKLVDLAQAPAVFFDFSELNRMTLHCTNEEKFVYAMHQIFTFAMENEQFPRLRYSGKTAEGEPSNEGQD